MIERRKRNEITTFEYQFCFILAWSTMKWERRGNSRKKKEKDKEERIWKERLEDVKNWRETDETYLIAGFYSWSDWRWLTNPSWLACNLFIACVFAHSPSSRHLELSKKMKFLVLSYNLWKYDNASLYEYIVNKLYLVI